MRIELPDHRQIDTDQHLNSEERHILQKLLCYQHFVQSVEEYREKKAKAFRIGWNNSGPVSESQIMAAISCTIENVIRERLDKGRNIPAP